MADADLDALLRADLADGATRLVLADALAEAGREKEAGHCRAGPVRLDERGRVERIHPDPPGILGAGLHRLGRWWKGIPKILKSVYGEKYIVVTGVWRTSGSGPLECGRVVLLDEGRVYQEELVESIFNWCQQEPFQVYYGDPGPVLRLFREAEKQPGFHKPDPLAEWKKPHPDA